MFLLCREGISSAAMDAYHQHTQILNRYTVAQIILTDTVVSTIRKEMRKLYPDLKIENQQITDILNNEVLKREVIEGEKVKETQQKLKKINAKNQKQAEKKIVKSENPVVAEPLENEPENT
jgi:predicted Holliday junction resolvase-like endonuclease